MGDFNLTKIDWATQKRTLNHITADYRLILVSQRAHLTQLVSISTHINNFTDLVFTSKENIITNVSIEMPFSTSDHDTICFDLLTSKPFASANAANTLNIPVKYDFSNIDHAGLASSLLATDWLNIFSQDDNINNAWDSFSLYISSLIAKYTPVKKIIFARKTPALPANILHLIKVKKASWMRYKKHRGIANKKIFYRLAKTVKYSIFAHRKVVEEKILLSVSIKIFSTIQSPVCTLLLTLDL